MSKPGQRIFITGASAGIGFLTAQALCQRGHLVWGTGRKAENLPLLENFHPIILDLNDQASIEAGYRKAVTEAGHFDVLINNAGNGLFGPLEGFSDAEFRSQLETLLLGPLALIRLALPAMRERGEEGGKKGQGLIVNVSSLAAEFPLPFLTPYSLSKAALSALTEGLSLELSHTGIRFIDLRPGDFATRFHTSTRLIESALSPAYSPNEEQAWKTIDENMRRAPDPKQVSQTLVKIVEGNIRRPVIAVGDIFQARIAPLLARLAPRGWVRWGLRKYYGLK